MDSSSLGGDCFFKKLGVYEELSKDLATSVPLPARLILVTKPNVYGGPARKKARIVICGNFQASKTPGFPSLRVAPPIWVGRLSAGVCPQCLSVR